MGGRGSNSKARQKKKKQVQGEETQRQVQTYDGNVFLKTPGTSLNPNGEVWIVEKNGQYKWVHANLLPDDGVIAPVDKSSDLYRQQLSTLNIKAGINKSGQLVVQGKGLYSRKKTFKSVDDFEKDAKKRLESAKLYYNGGLQSIKDGVLSQLEAENMKSILQKNPSAQALGLIRKEVRQTQKSLEYGLAAANDMTERLSRMVSTAKQKLNK